MEELISDLKNSTRSTIGEVLDSVLSQVDTYDLCSRVNVDDDLLDRATRGEILSTSQYLSLRTSVIRYLKLVQYD